MFRSTKSNKLFPTLLSPPKKQSPANALRPQAISVFRTSSPSVISPFGRRQCSHVSPIVSLNDSPSVPATCKMTGGATPDRLRPWGAPNPCRAPSCAPVAALAIRSRCGRAQCLAATARGGSPPSRLARSRCRPSPYGPVAVGRNAWPPPPVGGSPPSRLAPPRPVVRSHRIPEKPSPIGQIIVSFAYIPHF